MFVTATLNLFESQPVDVFQMAAGELNKTKTFCYMSLWIFLGFSPFSGLDSLVSSSVNTELEEHVRNNADFFETQDCLHC